MHALGMERVVIDLAACVRLIDLYAGRTMMAITFPHACPGEDNAFLITPTA